MCVQPALQVSVPDCTWLCSKPQLGRAGQVTRSILPPPSLSQSEGKGPWDCMQVYNCTSKPIRQWAPARMQSWKSSASHTTGGGHFRSSNEITRDNRDVCLRSQSPAQERYKYKASQPQAALQHNHWKILQREAVMTNTQEKWWSLTKITYLTC